MFLRYPQLHQITHLKCFEQDHFLPEQYSSIQRVYETNMRIKLLILVLIIINHHTPKLMALLSH